MLPQVAWQTETLSPSFLPRLGGSMWGIHTSLVDDARLIVRQEDNTIRVISMATRYSQRTVN